MEEEEMPLNRPPSPPPNSATSTKVDLISEAGLLSDSSLWLENQSQRLSESVSSFAMAAFGARFLDKGQVSRKRNLEDAAAAAGAGNGEDGEQQQQHYDHSRRLQLQHLQRQRRQIDERSVNYKRPSVVNGKDCWHDIEHVMGTEFLTVEEARLAFVNYAKQRLFPPVCLSPTFFACRAFGCPFRIRLVKDCDDDEEEEGEGNFEVDRESSALSHVHSPDIPKDGRIYARSRINGEGKDGEKARVRDRSKKYNHKKTDAATFIDFSLVAMMAQPSSSPDKGQGGGSGDADAWDFRRAWHKQKKRGGHLPGLGGKIGPAFASTLFFDSPGHLIPGYRWTIKRKDNISVKGRQAHFPPDYAAPKKLTKEARSVVRTERMTLDEMAMELSRADFAYLKWWLGNARNPSHLLRVIGTSAFDLEHTCMELQYEHSVFGGLNNHNNDGALEHAIFMGRGQSREGGFHVDNICYMAIDVYSLMSLRLESLVHIPINMRMPGAPVLLQAWAQRPADKEENQETRLHAMSATLNFFIQHLTQDQNRTKKWVYPVGSPAFSIYDMLPEFLELMRVGSDTRILSLLRESIIDGVFAENRDSLTQSILAFIAQKQDHLITRRMYSKLLLIFDNQPDVRTMHPVVNTLFRHFRHHPTPIQSQPEATRVDFYISKWTDVEFDSHLARHRPDNEEIRPHHFFYLLCFDTVNFSKAMRADIASSLTIDDYSPKTNLNELHHPAFNFCKRIETADRIYTPEFRDYAKHCAIPIEKGKGKDEADMRFYSSDTRDAWLLNGMYLTMASLQHLSWNPPVPYSVADLNPNLVHEDVPLAVLNPRLNVDNSFSNVRLEDPGTFALRGNYDLPVARTLVFIPSAETPAPRPFPRQREQQKKAKLSQQKQQPPPPPQAKGKTVIKLKGEGRAPFIKEEDVIYMSEFLLSIPLKNRPSDANASIEELDAYLLVRDPLYLQSIK